MTKWNWIGLFFMFLGVIVIGICAGVVYGYITSPPPPLLGIILISLGWFLWLFGAVLCRNGIMVGLWYIPVAIISFLIGWRYDMWHSRILLGLLLIASPLLLFFLIWAWWEITTGPEVGYGGEEKIKHFDKEGRYVGYSVRRKK